MVLVPLLSVITFHAARAARGTVSFGVVVVGRNVHLFVVIVRYNGLVYLDLRGS